MSSIDYDLNSIFGGGPGDGLFDKAKKYGVTGAVNNILKADGVSSVANLGKDIVSDTGEIVKPIAKKVSNKIRTQAVKSNLIDQDNNKWVEYPDASDNVGDVRGVRSEEKSRWNNKSKGVFHGSLVNKIHLIRLPKNIPATDKDYSKNFKAKTFFDLCKSNTNVSQYDPDDFLYCKNLGLPINRLITLRRFPYACTDNIFDKYNQSHPDIARMVTFFTDETNKLEDILQMSFGLRWKELTAEMEPHSMQGNQTGLSGFLDKIMPYIDPVLAKNTLRGENSRNFNPMYDQNKVYGPVDSINATNVRDVGLNYDKEFTIVFEYELRSYNGRTPEYAMRDVLANALAVTFNNAKFWGGARFWVGERPTQYLSKFQGILNPTSVDEWVGKARDGWKSVVAQFAGGSATSKIQRLAGAIGDIVKNIAGNAMAVGIGTILDKVGRASIITSNSLLSGEPIGNWHLTVGNPENPIMCIGNLICIGVDLKFPTEELSYGEFPTKMQFDVRLKPGMAKDKAGVETMFNMGRQRIYHNPKKINVTKNKDLAPNERVNRNYHNEEGEIESEKILHTFNESFDFTPLNVEKGTKAAKYYDPVTGSESSESFQKEVITGIANMEMTVDGKAFTEAHDYDADLKASSPVPNAAGLAQYEQLTNPPQPDVQNKFNAVQGNTGNMYENTPTMTGNPSVDKALATIRQKESSGNYNAQNPIPGQTASGAYGFINSTWRSMTSKYGIGQQYGSAKDAPPGIQDQIAARYVQDILKETNGDYTKIPLAWYTGNVRGEISAKALAVNGGMQPKAYQSAWIKIWNSKS